MFKKFTEAAIKVITIIFIIIIQRFERIKYNSINLYISSVFKMDSICEDNTF